ncbi:YqgE/AlgH family protein [Sphingomonas sp. ID0503]|uniref:YqgE/AlgH family protein n=1 Tax=Sphingomonas sp. ID0503 TaxID=3399691 RepID=UPI003AFAF9B7
MTASASLAGQILLAMPGIGDPRFDRAVIAVCAHDAEGALGIGIGRHVPQIRLHALLRQLDIDPGIAPDVAIHHGGPVEGQRGFVLHGQDWEGEDTIDAGPLWRLTGTLDVLRAIADGTGPSHWLVSLGYAGWGGAQLDGEMTRHGWFAIPGDDTLTFGTPADQRWTAGFSAAGIDSRLLSASFGTA